MQRHKFTEQEDEKLKGLVAQHGEKNWNLIAINMEDRNARQCRERWKNYLSPNAPNAGTRTSSTLFTPDEDQLIIKLFNSLGSKWDQIAQRLNGQTANQVKNRYMNVLRFQNSMHKASLAKFNNDGNHYWTPEETQYLKELREQHHLPLPRISEEMIKKFGDKYFTASNCSNKLAQLRIKTEKQARQGNEQSNSEIPQQIPTPVQQNPPASNPNVQTDTQDQVPQMENNCDTFEQSFWF